MIAGIGEGLLLIALCASLLQMSLWLLRHKTLWYWRLLPALSIGNTLAVGSAFTALIVAFSISDFSIATVFMHSHTAKPLLYKLSGTWGNHEGSILLWCWIITLYAAWMTLTTHQDKRECISIALHVMGGVQAAFLAYILLTSNPFTMLSPVPLEGRGLNPLLQDIGLALHPPILYAGYVGFAAAFALSIAGLVSGKADKDFAAMLHPYILFPWSLLTLGIGLGSWWAYRELGWGGWWFWDPVENASLLPWLTATALFHSNLVMRKYGNFQRWVMLLALLTFVLSLLGTFLVRSGVLTSVHSFASDPTRGLAILLIVSLVAGGGLFTFFRYGAMLQRIQPVRLFSREMAIIFNNLLLVITMLAILLAMLYPLIMELLGGQMATIGASYYHQVFIAFMLPLLLTCGLSAFLVWQHNPPMRKRRNGFWLFAISSLLAAAWTWWLAGDALCFAGLTAGVWIAVSVLPPLFKTQNKKPWGMIVGHSGLAIFVLAVTLQGSFSEHWEVVMKQGERKQLADADIALQKIHFAAKDNYIYRRGEVELMSKGHSIRLFPEERYYPVGEKFTTEAFISNFLTQDFYATMKRSALNESETSANAGITNIPVHIAIYRNIAMNWIWAGFGVVALSGMIALSRIRK